jgi:NOL1/NOP2/sun family putative RNA methylase
MPEPASIPQDLERYRSLVDDWAAFRAAVSRPLPTCLRLHPQRINAGELALLLEEDGMDPRPIGWQSGAFRIGGEKGPGRHWWYLAGLCHSQEEASMLPVHLLAPRPGDRVLDLCAAPGSKTAQIALALGNAGTVVANDVSMSRLRALRTTLDRLGLVNVSVTRTDGTGYPREAGVFDSVLVDAPCSGEGTVRRRTRATRARVGRDYTGLQRALLRKAVQVCRPGGRIVYSTCTFAPEENEAVVDAVLGEADLRSVPLQLATVEVPGLVLSPGVTEWNGQSFRSELRQAVRLWPHENDTGGFFVAVLRKGPGPAPHPVKPRELEVAAVPEWYGATGERFGIAGEVWGRFVVHRANVNGLHLAARDHRPPLRPAPEGVGVAFLKTRLRHPKPSTAAAMLLAAAATENVVELDSEQVRAYLDRETFPLEARQSEACSGTGYVLVRRCGHGLGVAFYDADKRSLRSLFPKRWTG